MNPMIIAHRGASKQAPENTIPAFECAWHCGADGIEADFRLTKDGHIVCIHDADTVRVGGKNVSIHATTLEDIKKVDVGMLHSKQYANTRIPTIAEVFTTIPYMKSIYLEVKCGPEIIAPLVEQIRITGLSTAQIVIISFNREVIKAIKLKAPYYKAFWLAGLRQTEMGKIVPSSDRVLEILNHIRADGFSSGKDLIDAAFIKRILEEGYEYHVWTVDDVPTAKRFKQWGAQSITTNVPDCVRKNLI